jgi:hypothetical protein
MPMMAAPMLPPMLLPLRHFAPLMPRAAMFAAYRLRLLRFSEEKTLFCRAPRCAAYAILRAAMLMSMRCCQRRYYELLR